MSKYLLLKNFNSYHNRVIKRYDSISDYINNSEDAVWNETRNFMPNDGINSKIVYNYKPDEMNWVPDYLIQCDNDSNIEKRYFVMEAVRTRNGQYDVDLRRDVVADYYDNILDANTFIEKATIKDISNPFLFNKEDMSFNQIKYEEEIPLKDETNSAWIVGYVASPQEDNPTTTEDESEQDDYIETSYRVNQDITTNNIDTWFNSHYGGTTLIYNTNDLNMVFDVNRYSSIATYSSRFKATVKGNILSVVGTISKNDFKYKEKYLLDINTRNALTNAIASRESIENNLVNAIPTLGGSMAGRYLNDSYLSTILQLNNKIVKDTSSGKYYNISVTTLKNNNTNIKEVNPTNAGAFYTDMQYIANNSFNTTSGNIDGFGLDFKGTTLVFVQKREITGNIYIKGKISADRRVLNDAPYCMFAIPYNDVTIRYVNQGGVQFDYVSSNGVDFAMARKIAEKYTGANKLYDLQLLPYCPRRDLIKNGVIDVGNSDIEEGVDYDLIEYKTSKDGAYTDIGGIIIWCLQSDFSFNITCSIPQPNTALNIKIDNETTFYRLCSPNYSGQFEFSASKNGGVRFINVDCCYKPFTPYIHANPNFGRLYGTDTNDTRGLICGGDFSLPQTSDQWATYELNNKNYNNSFERQITNMDIMRKYERADQIVNASVGAIGAGLTAGLSTGNIGIGIGAGVASAIGGTADVIHSEKKYQETIDYTRDQFGYQLGNVMARADTLAKVSAYNPNNKIFLFIEKYTCTDEEKEALREKLKYNGMSIGVIGKIGDYVQPTPTYIKGKIIRIYTGDDAHMNSEIYNELYKGVFI